VSYPNVLRRYLGTIVDVVTMWAIVFFVTRTPVAPQSAEWTWVFLGAVVLLYEPLLTIYGCTLGQALMRMRVRDEETLGRIKISQAYNRLFVKYFLGWISALTIPVQKRRQAIHDLITDTIVIEARDATRHRSAATAT